MASKKSVRTKHVHAQRVLKEAPSKRIIRYIVKDGETLWGIAAKYNVEVRHLASWNNLRKQHQLKKGQRLNIYVGRETSMKVS